MSIKYPVIPEKYIILLGWNLFHVNNMLKHRVEQLFTKCSYQSFLLFICSAEATWRKWTACWVCSTTMCWRTHCRPRSSYWRPHLTRCCRSIGWTKTREDCGIWNNHYKLKRGHSNIVLFNNNVNKYLFKSFQVTSSICFGNETSTWMNSVVPLVLTQNFFFAVILYNYLIFFIIFVI